MADEEGEGVGLPQKGLNMIIKDALPEMRIANETRELLNQCCVEFIKHVSKEAQQISSKDQRKTIYHDHVQKALKKLGFPREYVDAANSVLGECKIAAEKRLKRKNSRLDKCGIPEEQLWQMQQRLIEQARRNEAEKEQTIYGGPSHYSGADFQFQQQYQMLQQQQQQQYYQFQPQYLQAQQQNQFIQSAAQFPGSSSAMMGIGMPSSMATTMTGAAAAGASAMVPSSTTTMMGSMPMPTPPTSLQMPPLQWSMPPLPFGEIASTTMAPQQLHQQQQIQTPTALLQSLGLTALTPDAVGTSTATTESGIATAATAPALAQLPQIGGNNGQQQMVGGTTSTTTTGLMSATDAAFQQHLIFLQQQQSTSSSATPMMMALLNFDKKKKKKKKQKTTAPVADGGGSSGQKYGGADAEDDGDEDEDEDEEEEEEEGEEEEDYDV